MTSASAGTPPAPRRRRRRNFSLNGLAIQISAFALSFTLVALLVVGSSRAAFVEENENVTGRAPTPTSAPAPPAAPPGAPASPTRPEPAPAEEPAPEPEPEPLPEAPLPEAPLPTEVALTDDAAGTAMFGAGAGGGVLAPGVPEQRCLRVTFDGAADAGPVVLYAAEAQGALAPYLDLLVEVGPADGGSFGDCASFVPTATVFSGTLEGFGAGHGGYDSGLLTWQPTSSGDARSFRFTLTVRDDPAAEGLSAGFGFSWEART